VSAESPETVVVTGGNRGLGREACRQLAERGYRVVLTARRLEDAQAVAKELGFGVIPAALDVTNDASVRAFAERVRGELGPLSALVNNAGISMHGFNVDVVDGTLATNYFGALAVTRAVAPHLVDGGRLVMVSSGMGELSAYSSELRARFLAAKSLEDIEKLTSEFRAGVAANQHSARGWPSSAYRVSKAALNGAVRVLANQHPQLKVNAVCPGWVQTDMGGERAPRSVDRGASGIVWAATLAADGPSGGFFRDAKPISW
jgi:NAD(P)-dependent dehydrogenase (short-subunit alcohol dehydrogenase family)